MKSIIYFYENRYIELSENSDVVLNEHMDRDDNGLFSVTHHNGNINICGEELKLFKKTRISETVSAMLFDNREQV